MHLRPFYTRGPNMNHTYAAMIAEVSEWIDASNAGRDPEAITWGRLAKIAEENGEVIDAYIGATGQNPRKGIYKTMDDVRKELLDVAFTALAAYEHVTNHNGRSLSALAEHIVFLHKRAGAVVESPQP